MNKDDIDKHYDKLRVIILAVAALLMMLIYIGDTLYQNQEAQKNEPKYRMIIQFRDGRNVTVYEKDKTTAMEDYDSFDSGIKSMIGQSR